MPKGINKGPKNANWAGNEVGYAGIHIWVKRWLKKPGSCQKCGVVTTKLDAANISGKYKRLFSDWEYLCRRCHMTKDGRLATRLAFNKSRRIPDKQCVVCHSTFHSSNVAAVFCSKPCKGIGTRVTVCHRGHKKIGENLYVSPLGERHCRACFAINRNLRA